MQNAVHNILSLRLIQLLSKLWKPTKFLSNSRCSPILTRFMCMNVRDAYMEAEREAGGRVLICPLCSDGANNEEGVRLFMNSIQVGNQSLRSLRCFKKLMQWGLNCAMSKSIFHKFNLCLTWSTIYTQHEVQSIFNMKYNEIHLFSPSSTIYLSLASRIYIQHEVQSFFIKNNLYLTWLSFIFNIK